jgi:hypothetical protein
MPVRPFDSESKKLLVKLGTLESVRGFYISGSAGVALHLGHRTATAFDLYTEAAELASDTLEAELLRVGNVVIQNQSRSTLAVNIDGVPVRFLSHPFPLLKQTSRLKGIRVASPIDCALDTLIAISGHGSMRDFIDLYFVIKSGFMVRDLILRVPEKYTSLSYSVYQLLRAIAWFGDADSDAPPETEKTWKWHEVKAFFRKEVKRLMTDYFG